MRAQTPMLRQYFQAKEAHPGVLLAMRVGDFYEFYGEDAEVAAAALEITLTGREDGENGRVAMAGVPFHSVEKYLARLLAKGLKVALCDQVEDPKTAKGLVKREVTRVLTPGTVVEDSMLSAGQSNYLAAICLMDGRAGLATLDPSTGEFFVTEIEDETVEEKLLQELARLRPTEILLPKGAEVLEAPAREGLGASISPFPSPAKDRAERALLKQFEVQNLQGFGCEDKPSAIVAAAMVLGYAEKNGLQLSHVDSLWTYSIDGFMTIDLTTRRSLELTQNLADGSKNYTLLSILDSTVTSMGTRLLRRWIDQPLLDIGTIKRRQGAVALLCEHGLSRGEIRDTLKRVSDIERLIGRISSALAGPRDLAALRASLVSLPHVLQPLEQVAGGRLQEICQMIGDHSDLARLLAQSIVGEPPHTLREGGIICEGFDVELDKLRSLQRDGKSYIAALEKQEREKTGINSLKVGYNSVFGYYLEVTKAFSEKVPSDYIRKQTVANAERYITAELKDHESAVLGAEQKAYQLEAELFSRIRIRVAEHSRALLQTARALAELDVLASLAETASGRGYVRPELMEEDLLEIDGGRHPVVEAFGNSFVPNDTHLGESGESPVTLVVLTGPNMSGKSTYLRQNALIVLLSQIGSFVPAKRCRVGLCDRIFARIGAKDELALGQSTFMVEMVESANILNHATSRSLVILDEVGRGTSTFDGLAIAWAMAERLAEIGAKTLFATHYHQLNALAGQIRGVANYRVSVEEYGDDIVWTHKVLPGGTDRSYGLHVARMAGIPRPVLSRAAEILSQLEETEAAPKPAIDHVQKVQLTLFEMDDPEVVKALKGLNVENLTPVEALMWLDRWKKKLGADTRS